MQNTEDKNNQNRLPVLAICAMATLAISVIATGVKLSTDPVQATGPIAEVVAAQEPPGIEVENEPPGIADAPIAASATAPIMRVWVTGICTWGTAKGAKQTECLGVMLRRSPNPSGTPEVWAPNGVRVNITKSVGTISYVQLLNDDGTQTGGAGWIDDRWLVRGT